MHAPPDRTRHARTVGGSTGRPLCVMQNVRELVPEDGETDDENDRQEHHSNEIVHEIFSLHIE